MIGPLQRKLRKMSSQPRKSGLRRSVLLVVAVLMATSVLGAARKTGSSQSPLSWQSVEANTAIDRAAALDAARTAIGLDSNAAPTWIELGVLTDKYPFAEAFADRPVWIVSFPEVRVDRKRKDNPDSVKVGITAVIDSNDGRLLEAFTRSNDIWMLPVKPPPNTPRNPEAEASAAGWSVSPCKVLKLRSTVVGVLGSLWTTNGIDPKKAGQIIVRPRTVACALPAVEVDGNRVPVLDPGPFWIIHVMGTVTHPGGGGRRCLAAQSRRLLTTAAASLH